MPLPPLRFQGLDRLIDNLRGYQLEAIDDPDERQELEQLVHSGQATTYGYLLLAMQHARAGRFAEAAAIAEQAPAGKRYAVTLPLFRGCCLVQAGQAAAGWELLKPAQGKELTAPPKKNDDVGTAWMIAARANALWHQGERQAAYALQQHAVADKDASEARWNELAQMAAALEDWPAVIAAMEKVADHLRSAEALFAWAVALEATGRSEEVRPALEAALREGDFGALADSNPAWQIHRALWDPPSPDLGWLRKHKALKPLLDSTVLTDVRWVDAATSKEHTKKITSPYKKRLYTRGMIWSPAWWDACGAAAKGKVLVAWLPEVPKRGLNEVSGALFMDKSDPDHLWLTPNPDLPAALWIRVPCEEQALLDALRWWYPVRRRKRLELSQSIRAYAGNMSLIGVPNPYHGQLEAAGVHEIQRMWISSPAVDHWHWGSAVEDDPWPHRMRLGGFELASAQERHGAQLPDSLPRFSHRTHFSGSQIALEVHPFGNYVWDLRYRPSPYAEPIRRLNEEFGFRLPLDLPIDVAAACIGFEFAPYDWLVKQVDDPAQAHQRAAVIALCAAVGYGDLRTTEDLRRWVRDPDPERAAPAINAMIRYNYNFLLAEAGTLPLPEDFLAVIAERLEEGNPTPFVGLYPGDDGEDEE